MDRKSIHLGFAHGAGGDKLKGKSFLLSLTLGGTKEAYNADGHNQHPVEYFIKPIELFMQYCGLTYLPPVYSHSMSVNPVANESLIETKAILQANKIKRSIMQLLTANETRSIADIPM